VGRRWKTGPFAHTRASVVGISMEPSVVGRDWSPVSSNKPVVTAVELRVDHRAPLQPRRVARRYLRVCRCIASRAGIRAASASYPSCRSGSIYIKQNKRPSPFHSHPSLVNSQVKRAARWFAACEQLVQYSKAGGTSRGDCHGRQIKGATASFFLSTSWVPP
jgi:hypothetical protein